MSDCAQESVLIDVWTVPSGRQADMIKEPLAPFEPFRLIDGFIQGGVLAHGDDTKVASYLRVRSAADLQRGAVRDEVRGRMSALAAIGSSHADAYERMWGSRRGSTAVPFKCRGEPSDPEPPRVRREPAPTHAGERIRPLTLGGDSECPRS